MQMIFSLFSFVYKKLRLFLVSSIIFYLKRVILLQGVDMKKLVFFFCSFSFLFAGKTLYIPLFQWERINEYQLSNLTLSMSGDVSLSPGFLPLANSDKVFWCATGWKNTLVVGTAEGGAFLWISGTNVQENTLLDHEIISAVAGDDNFLYMGAIPNASLYLFNTKREIVARYAIEASYIWGIIPSPQGVWILTGEPAALYLLRGNKIQKIASFSHERHILKGIWTEDGLYFIGESSFLYLLPISSQAPRVVAEFSDVIQDFTADGKVLYVGINKFSSSARKNDQNERQEVIIYRYEGGTASVLTTIAGARLTRLFFWQKKLYMGNYQNFFIYDISMNMLFASGYGRGGVKLFAVAQDRLHIFTEKPARIFQMDVTLAKEGSLISFLLDAEQKARWGKVLGLESISLVSLMTRSSMSFLSDLFEEWVPYQKQIGSQPNRYLQVFLSFATPSSFSLREIMVSASPLNQAPEILRFNVNQQGEKLFFSWSVRDPDRDDLLYTLFIKRKTGWLPLFSSPLTNNSIEISSRMLPEGKYFFLLSISDAPSNPSDLSFTTTRESGLITIDHTPPLIKNFKATLIKNRLQCEWNVSDDNGIDRVWYSFSPLEWKPILPIDGLIDGQEETFSLSLENFMGGYIQIKVKDSYGNEKVYGHWLTP